MANVERGDLTTLSLTGGSAGTSQIIHPTFAQDIIKAAVESSIALSLFPLRQVPTGQMSIPVLSALPLAYWVDEAYGNASSKKKTTEPAWQGAVLKLQELAAIVPIPLAVLEDAAGGGHDLWSEIRPLVGQAIAMKVDEAVFLGGTGAHTQPTGWAPGLVTQAVTAANTSDDSTLGSIQAANEALIDVENSGFDPDFWVASRGYRGKLRGLMGTDGHPVYLSGVRSDSRTDEFMGVPITYAHGVAWDNTVALALTGDRNAVIMGASTEGMRVDILKEATLDISALMDGSSTLNLAQQNLVALRMSFRVAYTTAVPANVNGTGVPFAVVVP